MSAFSKLRWRWAGFALAGAVLMLWAGFRWYGQSSVVEVALIIGEPWEDMRQRSSANISPAMPNAIWHGIPTSDARLRLVDPQFGFMTPQARFFTIGYVRNIVSDVRMSPQIEPLLLDDTLRVVLGLQEQWRKSGWEPIKVQRFPSFADTPEWRARLRDENSGGVAYWRAGDKYRTMLVVGRFEDEKRPAEERYLITLEISEWQGEP